MDVTKPLYWYQGLFLQPQHFQLWDLYHQWLLADTLGHFHPFSWGVISLEVEEASLGNFVFEVRKGKFLFPDGSLVTYPGNALIEPRSFEEDWTEGGRPLTVYLGLRKWDQTGGNVTVIEDKPPSQIHTRYVAPADPEEVIDLHGSGPAAQVRRAQYLLKILWDEEVEEAGDYFTFPVAKLIRVGEEVKLSEEFIPPAMVTSSSEVLTNLLKELREQLSSRARQLEAYKRERDIHGAEFGSRDMAFLLALRSLGRYTPLLYHITEGEGAHPWLVYGLLRSLIGELSSFSRGVTFLGEVEDEGYSLPPYDHRDLWGCFSAARRVLLRLLDEITAGPDYVIELLFDGTYYAAELRPAIFEGRNRYFLSLQTEEDPQAVIQAMETVAKLGAREQLPLLIARALPGVRLEYLPVPPHELPRRAHCLYFAINHHGEQWDHVEKGRNIALYWDGAPEDLRVELMVVRR